MQDVALNKSRVFPLNIRIIFGLIFLAGFFTFLILLGIFPHVPNSMTGWVILVGVGVPSWLFLEWLGEKLFSKKVGHRISEKPFSGVRILYALGTILAFFVGMFALWKLFGPWVRPYFS